MLKTRKERHSQNVCMVNIFKTARNNEVGSHFEWLRKGDHCSSGLDNLKVSSQKIVDIEDISVVCRLCVDKIIAHVYYRNALCLHRRFTKNWGMRVHIRKFVKSFYLSVKIDIIFLIRRESAKWKKEKQF